jgi:hypothetical protein
VDIPHPAIAHFRCALLIGLLDPLLRRKAPAFEVFPDDTDWHLDAQPIFDQWQTRLPVLKRKSHLELIGSLIADQATNLR